METCFECGKRDHYFNKIGVCVLRMWIHYLLMFGLLVQISHRYVYFCVCRIFFSLSNSSVAIYGVINSKDFSLEFSSPHIHGFVGGGGMVIHQGLNFSWGKPT